MNEKELIIALLEKVPDNKMGYLLAYIQGMTAGERQKKFFLDVSEEHCEVNVENKNEESYTLSDYMKDSESFE